MSPWGLPNISMAPINNMLIYQIGCRMICQVHGQLELLVGFSNHKMRFVDFGSWEDFPDQRFMHGNGSSMLNDSNIQSMFSE